MTEFQHQIQIPAGVVKPGHAYRVRVRMQDNTGRWGHWSDAVQFVPSAIVPQSLIDSLRISEVHYNPADPTADEMATRTHRQRRL